MNKFDDLTKKFTDGMSRRDVLKAMGLSVIGAMLAPWGGATEAAYDDEELGIDGFRKYHCPNPVVCPGPVCGDGDCPCVPTRPAFRDGKGWCATNIACDGATPCSRSRDCKNAIGAGWKCAVGCCPTSVCAPYCGGAAVDKVAIKALQAQHKGLTLAG